MKAWQSFTLAALFVLLMGGISSFFAWVCERNLQAFKSSPAKAIATATVTVTVTNPARPHIVHLWKGMSEVEAIKAIGEPPNSRSDCGWCIEDYWPRKIGLMRLHFNVSGNDVRPEPGLQEWDDLRPDTFLTYKKNNEVPK